MRFSILIFLLTFSTLSYSISEQEWQCKKLFTRYEQIDRLLQKDAFAECMARPENQRPGRAGVCSAAQAGQQFGSAGLIIEQNQLDRLIRSECLTR